MRRGHRADRDESVAGSRPRNGPRGRIGGHRRRVEVVAKRVPAKFEKNQFDHSKKTFSEWEGRGIEVIISVTRCWNKKWPKKYPRRINVFLKCAVFQNSPSCQIFWLLLKDEFKAQF